MSISQVSSDYSLSVKHPRYLSVTADMTSATWNTVASHEVFTVTGIVRMRIWIQCVTTLDSDADGASFQAGRAGATDSFVGSVVEATFVGGRIITSAPQALVVVASTDIPFDYIFYSTDFGYEITGEALTSGNLIFHCVWDPLSAGASVVAGVGGSL